MSQPLQALSAARLYGICDLGYLTRETALPVSRALLEGGAGILQLRAKGHEPESLLPLAVELRKLCVEFGIPFIVNDHLDLALESEAHGLHLGQDDGSLSEARQKLPPGAIIGRSTHSREQASHALEEQADYIGYGPLFPTPTKKGRPAIGLQSVQQMQADVGSKIPAFCIGGIKPENLSDVLTAGARRIVVVSHLLTADDPAGETRQIVAQLPNL